jgi:predicted membrane channel-forming protein YqfA (hemolysin III family)
LDILQWTHLLCHLPQGWTEDSFYAWTYDLPASPWLLIGSIGLAVAVLLLCLFPLAPYKLKIAVVYVSLGLVSLLLGTIVLRCDSLLVMPATYGVGRRQAHDGPRP